MAQLNHERRQAKLSSVKPCDVFDLIGGTSTGGLIAIMLGRLGMDVDECIMAYNNLTKRIFNQQEHWVPLSWTASTRGRYSSQTLELAIQEVISNIEGVTEADKMDDGTERRCRVFVCATAIETTGTTCLRSYNLHDGLGIPATICEAALATSAATTFFDPVTIGNRRFADGALGANNPVEVVEGEIKNIWSPFGGKVEDMVQCFVSIGTGDPGKFPVQHNMGPFLYETLKKLATETETTARKFAARWHDYGNYFRFNVQQGLQGVGLHEWEKQGVIEAATAEYLGQVEQKSLMRQCVMNLKSPPGKGIPNHNKLRSDSIFLPQRLLVREDLELFLTEALKREGVVRVVLHGLPGTGKSTMARYFAYKNGEDMPILWIPATSELEIQRSFEVYAKQICGEDVDHTEPVTLVRQRLSQLFPGHWLVVFDGLDDQFVNIQRYLFADIPGGKILITTRRKDLAGEISATHELQVKPLDMSTAEDLLDAYIMRTPPTEDEMHQEKISTQERDARRHIVKELGGLPLAISILGASMRPGNGNPRMNCQAYLTWSDEGKDGLLQRAPKFCGYSSSVWKAFDFAFQPILSSIGGNQHAASVAYFAASCENASSLKDYFRLYQQFKTKKPAINKTSLSSGIAAVDVLRFLDEDIFNLAIDDLASVNMITLNWIEDGHVLVPYIEMHSLVRRWLERRNLDRSLNHIAVYTAPKLWLLGFGMYDQMDRSQVALKAFDPLMTELKASLDGGIDALHDSCVPAPELIFPFLLEAQKSLSQSISHLPAGSNQHRRLREFSVKLESELITSFEENLKDLDWDYIFGDFTREFEEQVEYAVESDAKNPDYLLKDFFLNTLDSHGCIPIAFSINAPWEFSAVGQTNLIEDIRTEITAETESLLEKCLSREAIKRAEEILDGDSCVAIGEWANEWSGDVAEIVRRCLAKVLTRLYPGADMEGIITSRSQAIDPPDKDMSFGDYFQAFTSSSDPRNAFFAILRQAVKRAAGQFLSSSEVIDILDARQEAFRDGCEAAVRRALGDRAQQAFHNQALSSETETGEITIFGMLWELAWPARFPGGLEDLIAAQVLNPISEELQNASKTGFVLALEPFCQRGSQPGAPSVAESLAVSVFDSSNITNLFLNWIAAGWIDPPSDVDDDSDDGEGPTHTLTLDDAQRGTLEAMKAIYDSLGGIIAHDSALEALKRTLECREELHGKVMGRLSQPNLTDRTGLGPFFAKMYFEDCDKSLRFAYLVLGGTTAAESLGTLDRLAKKESEWKFKGEH